MSGWPIVVGRCTLSLAPAGYQCQLQTANPSPPGSSFPFSPGSSAALYTGNPGAAGQLSRYVVLAKPPANVASLGPVPPAMVLPPTAVAPDLLTAVCAAVTALAVVQGDIVRDFDVLADISTALLVASRTPGSAGLVAGAKPPLSMGFVVP